MGTNYTPHFADLFLFSYESEFLQTLVKNKKIKEARSSNITFRYIDEFLFINNLNFSDLIPLIYPPELDNDETTDTVPPPHFKTYTSNLTYTVISIPESMTNETILILKLLISPPVVAIYQLQLHGNIPFPTNSVFKRLELLFRICKRHQWLGRKMINQGYVQERLASFLKKKVNWKVP